MDKLELTVDSQEFLASPEPGLLCPIVTKDRGARFFITCRDLTKAESVGV
jgi:hypothetical protein